MSGPSQRERRADEAYWRGRDEGYDRGYEEGRAAATPSASSPPAPPQATPKRPAVPTRRLVEAGVLVAAAVVVWRALRTWPGRLVAVGLVLACSGLLSLGAAVVAVLVGAVVVAWALRTGERAVADVRTTAANVRAISARRRTR